MLIRPYASDVMIHIDGDAAYLVLPNAKSLIAGCFYLPSRSSDANEPMHNDPTLVMCQEIRLVASSAAEVETSRVFTNAQLALHIRYTL